MSKEQVCRTVESMSELEAKAMLTNLLESVRAGREEGCSGDFYETVVDEMAKAGLDIDAPCSYMAEADPGDAHWEKEEHYDPLAPFSPDSHVLKSR